MRISHLAVPLALLPGFAAAQDATLAAPVSAHEPVVPFFSLANPHLIIIISFLIFVAALIYLKVPARLAGMLDSRAANIRRELDEARKLREEAQSILSSYERKAREAEAQVERIIATAQSEAQAAAKTARADLASSITRRLAAAEDRIASAQAAAVREVKDRAAEIAVTVAGELIAGNMTEQRGNALIDDAIGTVEAKLH